ncbi:MAG: hypothetical protein RR314_02680 [Oscillospiraceae bacterium]
MYPTCGSQAYIDSAFSIRPRCAELIYADVNVEAVTFNKGYYTVDVTYFYRVTGETFPGGHAVRGLAVFNKRVMLFGSEGGVKTFSSDPCDRHGCLCDDTMPIAQVEAVDPIALHMKLVDADCCLCAEGEGRDIPGFICESFCDNLNMSDASRRLYVTLGQFTIVRLERDTQLLIPAYDYCVPEKECAGSTEDDPCTLFSRIRFPVEEFFPPDSVCDCDNYKQLL